jgi:hypothetical protein
MVAVFDQVNAIATIGPLFCADAPQNFSLLYSNEVQTVKTDSYISALFDKCAVMRNIAISIDNG